MALIKLSAGTDQYWLLNDIPHQRGVFDVSAKIGSDTVEIYAVSTLKSLARANYDEFSPDGITPYASTQALIDDLKTFFFRSVAGGGGAVNSVNGQTGVVVLDADDIPDTTTTNKWFNPVASKVLTGYVDSQNNNVAVSNATQPNLTTYLTLVVSGLDLTSRYRVTVDFIIGHDATNSNAVVDIKDFGVSVLPQVYTVEPKDNSNVTWDGIAATFMPNPLGGGQIQLQLDFGTDDVADDTTMYFANLSLQKINE